MLLAGCLHRDLDDIGSVWPLNLFAQDAERCATQGHAADIDAPLLSGRYAGDIGQPGRGQGPWAEGVSRGRNHVGDGSRRRAPQQQSDRQPIWVEPEAARIGQEPVERGGARLQRVTAARGQRLRDREVEDRAERGQHDEGGRTTRQHESPSHASQQGGVGRACSDRVVRASDEGSFQATQQAFGPAQDPSQAPWFRVLRHEAAIRYPTPRTVSICPPAAPSLSRR